MGIVRRLTAVAGTAVLLGAFATAPASADTPEVYAGSALGRALNVSVLGSKATFGVSDAKINSTLKATANGAGQLLVLGSITKAEASGANARKVDPQKCAAAVPPGTLPALALGLACSTSTAEVVNGLPHAVSEGSLVSLDLGLNQLPINTVIAPVEGALTQVFGALPDTLDPATNTVTDLLKALGNTKTLAVKVGASRSEVSTAAGTVTSVGTAEAAQVDILPIGGLNKQPVASIIVSSAKATAVYNRETGAGSGAVDPALVTLRLNVPLTGPTEVKLAPGQTTTILAGTPLESTITVAAGKSTKNADGSISSIADGVKLELLKGVSGGIVLELAHAEAGVAGTPASVTPIIANVELPRTGGTTPWIPIAGISALGIAVLTRRLVLSLR